MLGSKTFKPFSMFVYFQIIKSRENLWTTKTLGWSPHQNRVLSKSVPIEPERVILRQKTCMAIEVTYISTKLQSEA
jgi:hypothetical protein